MSISIMARVQARPNLTRSSQKRRHHSPSAHVEDDACTYHLVRVSRNYKTGPIPVTTTSANSCPPSCSFKGSGCYAESGPLAIHWRHVSEGRRGCTFDELLREIATLRRRALWRHNQAGDLTPEAPGVIDARMLTRLAMANRGRRGFTYTHYPPTPANQAAILNANRLGFTVNLSAETLTQADAYVDLGIAPVVVVLPQGVIKPTRTPAGRQVIVCPASTGNSDCLNCGICQQRDRAAVVGFPAHGSGAKRVEGIFFKEVRS
ncbi:MULTISPECIES: hypothetical protein [unclassified Variovorax]|uniref:DUF7227 family protein n=1 Tax=unclassified Variovorax TaxID=663243 RepID=UPI0032E5891F